MMNVTDGVYAFPLTLEIDHPEAETDEVTFHPSAVETDRGLLLIDAGYPGSIEGFEENLAEQGFEWADVWGVALTHQDADHAGGLADIVERADPVVFAHRECAPYVDGREHPIKIDDDAERFPAADVDVELVEGARFDTLAGPIDVYHTPGHAPGHVSYHLPEERLLISGDALLAVERTLSQHGGIAEHDPDRIAEIHTEAVENARSSGQNGESTAE
ncbi:MBL fold metallo-hydrolase [Halobacteriales archaeon QH_1_68_42]|nr:MAG: MBL fold metallo-hydrolase [Halobacteriales archaeon QH_1_68_42]